MEHFRRDTEDLVFDAFVNSPYGPSWMINFKQSDVIGCMITFGPDDMDRFIDEMGQPLSQRHFVVGPNPERAGCSVVQLGNSRFTIRDTMAQEFADVVDEYLREVQSTNAS